jgi:hypothetical protein
MTARHRSLAVAAILASLCILHPTAWSAEPPSEWGVPALMTALAQVHTSTARFVETRYVQLLNQAQKSSGQLIYAAPNQLQKITTAPVFSRITINGDRLTVERQGEPTRELSLRDNAELGALVESIRATLAGDLPALNRYFAATLQGGTNNWTLLLIPRDARLLEMVAAIQIKGERATIREVETREADGDRTDMAILPGPG